MLMINAMTISTSLTGSIRSTSSKLTISSVRGAVKSCNCNVTTSRIRMRQALWLFATAYLQVRNRSRDGAILTCPASDCRASRSVRKHSFFEGKRLSLPKLMKVLVCFVSDISATDCSKILHIRRATVSILYGECRQTYSSFLEVDPIRFVSSGPYEVDEFYFKHVKGTDGRYHNQWILDIFERETGQYWFEFIPNRSGSTLVATVAKLLPPGSLVFTDDWPGYRDLDGAGFEHYTVTHSRGEYARPMVIRGRTQNVHINSLEGTHRVLRRILANKSRRHVTRMQLHLREYSYKHSEKPSYFPFSAK